MPWSVFLTVDVCRIFRLGTLVSVLTCCGGSVCHAGAAMPEDPRVGLFYALTHLHPLAYFILFLIFALSVVNLVVQGWISRDKWPLNLILQASGRSGMSLFGFWATKRTRRPRVDSSVSIVQGGPDHMGG